MKTHLPEDFSKLYNFKCEIYLNSYTNYKLHKYMGDRITILEFKKINLPNFFSNVIVNHYYIFVSINFKYF